MLFSVQSFKVKDLPEKMALMRQTFPQKATHLLRDRFNFLVWNGFDGFLLLNHLSLES